MQQFHDHIVFVTFLNSQYSLGSRPIKSPTSTSFETQNQPSPIINMSSFKLQCLCASLIIISYHSILTSSYITPLRAYSSSHLPLHLPSHFQSLHPHTHTRTPSPSRLRAAQDDYQFFDTTPLNVAGGPGGTGCVSFLREKGEVRKLRGVKRRAANTTIRSSLHVERSDE